jgi:hypothetical protein
VRIKYSLQIGAGSFNVASADSHIRLTVIIPVNEGKAKHLDISSVWKNALCIFVFWVYSVAVNGDVF